ncbi:MAG: DUF3127 domain-containing protein [Muribaculum sp.]|nr:DUF3127 domain-containing protein [Muribaculum sp.]
MEIEGKIILALPEQSGTSKAGNEWKKREYVLETHESFPRKVHFDLFGQKADQYPLNVGDEIRLSFDINSREYNGRWFTSISGWKVEPAGQPQGTPAGNMAQDFPGAAPFPPAPAAPDLSADPSDDLPF